ncbi:hypothetical protein Tco_0250458 [Tanacetum coccineum]
MQDEREKTFPQTAPQQIYIDKDHLATYQREEEKAIKPFVDRQWCRVNYQALKFFPEIDEMANRLILSLYPQLQPLVAVMGWDLLPGKTDIRRKLLQLLWTSKSQILRLEESSFYGNKSDEVSCVEHLCDFLCYQLDLASFVACVNSGTICLKSCPRKDMIKDPLRIRQDFKQMVPELTHVTKEARSSCIWKTFGGNTRNLGSIWEKTNEVANGYEDYQALEMPSEYPRPRLDSSGKPSESWR